MSYLTNKDWHKCRKILTEWSPAPSKAHFVESVQRQIEANPDVFPSEAQAKILNAIYRTLERKHMSDAERDARESLGLKV